MFQEQESLYHYSVLSIGNHQLNFVSKIFKMKPIPFWSKYIWTGDNEYLSIKMESEPFSVSVRIIVRRSDGDILRSVILPHWPFNKEIKVYLCEILRGMQLPITGEIPECEISVQDGAFNYSNKFFVIGGSCCGLSREKLLSTHILTQSPQSVYRLKNDEEGLFCVHGVNPIIGNRKGIGEKTVISQSKCTKIYMKDGSILSFEDRILDDPAGRPHIEKLDVSYSYLSDKAKKEGFTSLIVAVDIWLKASVRHIAGAGNVWTEDVSGKPLRFIYRDIDSDDVLYRFINDFGVYESILATGTITRLAESERKSFLSGGFEQEIERKTQQYYEQSTGYISSEDELSQWYAFLSSQYRYVSKKGSKEYAPIILTDQDTKFLLKSTGILKFTWHYAETGIAKLPKMIELEKFIDSYDNSEPSFIDNDAGICDALSKIQDASPNDNIEVLMVSPFDKNKLYKCTLGKIRSWMINKSVYVSKEEVEEFINNLK